MSTDDQTRRARRAEPLRAASGVMMLLALGLAPLNYGSTRPMPFEILIALVATGSLAWLLACAFASAWTLPPRAALWGTALVALSAGAWLVFLRRPSLPAFTRQHYADLVYRWPQNMVPRSFSAVLIWGLAAIGGLFVLHDLATRPAWRLAIAIVMVASGVGVALLGLAQNATHAAGIYWASGSRMPGAFFGPFFHHTSGGAYLNTVWPLALALALVAVRKIEAGENAKRLLGGSLLAFGVIFAAHTAHVSRFPQVIAVCALLAFALWTGVWRMLGRIPYLRPGLGLAVVALGLLVVTLGATRLHDIGFRWGLLNAAGLRGGAKAIPPAPESEWPRLMRGDLFVASDHSAYPLGDRGATYAAAFKAIGQRPWFGWGPGGWTAAAAANSADPFVRTFFLIVQFTHCDLLQTCIEWGLVGAAGWVLLVPGSLVSGIARLGRRPAGDYLGAGAVVALAAVLIQSSIDFPLEIPAIQLNAIALAALGWSVPTANFAV